MTPRSERRRPRAAGFDLTTSEIWFDKPTNERRERTVLHKIAVYGPLVKVVQKCVRKGARVYVEGQIETRRWVGKDGSPGKTWTTEIIVQGWSGRLTILDFANGEPAAKTEADADDFAASRSTAKYGDDMIDPEWFPKTGKRRAGELSFRGKGNLL